MFAARSFKKSDVAGAYYGKIVYQGLLLRQSTRKVCCDGGSVADMARVSKYALQLRLQNRRFDWIPERLGNGGSVCCATAFFCVWPFIKEHRYVEESK